MKFSSETSRQIEQFASQQARHYLEDAEMTYLEKLRYKGDQAVKKAGAKLSRFKASSTKAQEVRDDLTLYMNDYMQDLVSQGMSEAEALEKARQELAYSADSDRTGDLRHRLEQYYEQLPVHLYEAVGLYYGAGLFIGMSAGALGGVLVGIYTLLELEFSLWIPTLVGLGGGGVLGLGFGMLMHARMIREMEK